MSSGERLEGEGENPQASVPEVLTIPRSDLEQVLQDEMDGIATIKNLKAREFALIHHEHLRRVTQVPEIRGILNMTHEDGGGFLLVRC